MDWPIFGNFPLQSPIGMPLSSWLLMLPGLIYNAKPHWDSGNSDAKKCKQASTNKRSSEITIIYIHNRWCKIHRKYLISAWFVRWQKVMGDCHWPLTSSTGRGRCSTSPAALSRWSCLQRDSHRQESPSLAGHLAASPAPTTKRSTATTKRSTTTIKRSTPTIKRSTTRTKRSTPTTNMSTTTTKRPTTTTSEFNHYNHFVQSLQLQKLMTAARALCSIDHYSRQQKPKCPKQVINLL